MKGPNGERLGDPVEGEHPSERNCGLVVIDLEGYEQPGFILRAGDFITKTEYDHSRRVLTAHVGERPLAWRTRLRRWREGRRNGG